MVKIKKIVHWLVDFIEVYLPSMVFLSLFIIFLANVFFRYVLHNPQNWTFEFSVYAFVVVGLLGAALAYRKEDHVVFDLVYERLSNRKQNLMRIFSNFIVIVFFGIAIPPSIRYVVTLPSVTSIMRIPEGIIFACLPILLISTFLRSFYRLISDIKVYKAKTYVQEYNTQDKDGLI